MGLVNKVKYTYIPQFYLHYSFKVALYAPVIVAVDEWHSVALNILLSYKTSPPHSLSLLYNSPRLFFHQTQKKNDVGVAQPNRREDYLCGVGS